MAPVAVGTGLAVGEGVFAPGPALAALLGALLIQVGTNLANDYYDYVRGGDTEERIGPTRVTQAGLLEPRRVLRGARVVFAAAIGVGLYLTWVAGWPVVAIGVASVLAGIAYTAGPFPLAYHGLGDLFVFLFFGLVAVGGTYYVQALKLTGESLLAGAGVGALTTAILVVNNLRDLDSDARAGKRTLAVRLGPLGTRAEYLFLLALAFGVPVAGVGFGPWSLWALLPLLAAGVAVVPIGRVVRYRGEPERLIPALGQTAATTGLYGLLLAVGLALG